MSIISRRWLRIRRSRWERILREITPEISSRSRFRVIRSSGCFPFQAHSLTRIGETPPLLYPPIRRIFSADIRQVQLRWHDESFCLYQGFGSPARPPGRQRNDRIRALLRCAASFDAVDFYKWVQPNPDG